MFQSGKKNKEKEITEFYRVIYGTASHPVVRQMRKFPHHGNTSCYRHCLAVSYYTYFLCTLMRLRAEEAARAGMLHDLFLYDWHTHAKETGSRFHGLKHPKVALNNAQEHFKISEVEKDMILKHMWPLTVIPPRYPESFIISMVDKYCCIIEFFEGFGKE